MDDIVLMTMEEVAKLIPGANKNTMVNLKVKKKGPPYHIIANKTYYYKHEVMEWLQKQ